jgi:hypothetical protein
VRGGEREREREMKSSFDVEGKSSNENVSFSPARSALRGERVLSPVFGYGFVTLLQYSDVEYGGLLMMFSPIFSTAHSIL